MEEIIERAKQNIWQALEDYGAHTDQTEILDDVTSSFVNRLAKDSSYAKQELRELFRKSPVWCEELDALVINGTRTHDPDYNRIRELAVNILWTPAIAKGVTAEDVRAVINFFSEQEQGDRERARRVEVINRLAPKAYVPGKKLSRVFKSICKSLGIADETAGSEFQKLYAQFADELTSRKISFKLFVSINPAHFITMSNPKCDNRGPCLTSCHSFNSTEYEYNNGCSGYARDKYTFIVFTVDDPTVPETLNNRKTTRQIFAYKPGNGLLLQSRMYNTSGGVYGAAEDSKLYRDLVQREISALEEVPNLWKTGKFVDNEYSDCISTGFGFGGYEDWTHSDFDAHVSIRNDHAYDYESFAVGTYGLCICCGDEISEGLYCNECKEDNSRQCDCCGEYVSELCTVHDSRGDGEIEVCLDCRDESYSYCDECGEYWDNDSVTRIANGNYVCDECLREYYEECDVCGEYFRRSEMTEAQDVRGIDVYVCESCYSKHYECCDECGAYRLTENMRVVHRSGGDVVVVCEDCIDEFTACPECSEYIEECDDGTCPNCGCVIEKEAVTA